MKKIFYIMKKVKYVILCTIVFYACTNSEQQEKILELEKENKLLIETIDSLKQTDAFKFNEIFSKESGRPDDTALIKEYRIFLDSAETDFWKNFINNRISIIKTRPAKQAIEKKLFGIWKWIETDGGWGVMETPETENITRKIVINEDYTILYFRNGVKTKQDSFYITTISDLSSYHTVIHLIHQNKTEAFQLLYNDELTFYTPWFWGMDFPSEKYKRIKKQKK